MLRAIGDTITPLIILAISVALNVAGDIFFVVIVKAGVRGAVATVLAQLIAFIVCAFYMVKKYDILRLSRTDFKGMESAMVKNMLGGGLSMGFMSSLVNIGSLTLRQLSISLVRILSWHILRRVRYLRYLWLCLQYLDRLWQPIADRI